MARVLIVDDSKMIREIMRQEILNCGHTPAGEAAGGDEAVRLFLSLAPDLVLMDIVLDDGDGLEAAQRIRSAAPAARIAVVSALPRESVQAELERLGIRDYIGKPFTLEELRSAFTGLR